ncbi:MAG TPA: efflux RND transporter periplasmic adaptor subunit [Candidatus Sulfotelmatobacter sp.]|nr:efflux RND transporter periplasmic adaptor subunit [Candidatus Sulfotelmatobacter sp.]
MNPTILQIPAEARARRHCPRDKDDPRRDQTPLRAKSLVTVLLPVAPRLPKNRWLAAGIALLLVGSPLLTGCTAKGTSAVLPEITATETSVVVPTNAPQLSALTVEPVAPEQPLSVPLAGRLVWDEEATVRVFTPFAGIVRKLFVNLNQPISKGAPLAEIQSADFSQVQADARKAASEFRRAERNLTRIRDLAEHGAAPRKDVESSEADYASAQAEQDRAAARLSMYDAATNSADHSFLLPSPLNGIVVEKNLTPGQEVRPDQMLANAPQFTAPLFVITDPARLWLQIDATEEELPHLHPGREFTFVCRAFPGQTFTGRVETVSEFIDPNTRTIKVRGVVDNASRQLKAEMFVSVNLPVAEHPGASVPAKAVFLSGEKHYVFIEEQPGKFTRQEVQAGAEHQGQILVLAGVQPGQRVVTDGCLLLQRTLK